MYDLGVIYDYSEDGSWPAWLMVKPQGDFDWKQETLYFPLHTPFQRFSRYDIDDSSFGLSIVQTELVVNMERPDQLGIYLPRVKERLKNIRGEEYAPSFKLSDIQHFIISMHDIEIVAQMNLVSNMDFR
ncbi:hypothetical protein [Paenibacillus macerans]|uniref:hypothetical protein n=1 Tax=Paenibacillus macerans TaxID=44252 RepID=UPI003D320DD6